MNTVLELHFLTESGRIARLVIHDPREDLDPAEIKGAMEEILASGVFYSGSENMTAIKEARLVSRDTRVIEIL